MALVTILLLILLAVALILVPFMGEGAGDSIGDSTDESLNSTDALLTEELEEFMTDGPFESTVKETTQPSTTGRGADLLFIYTRA